MKKLLVSFLLILALTVLIVPAAGAQEKVECFNLDPADCAILNAAAVNTDNLVSFTQDFSLAINASGLELLAMFAPEVPPAISFTVTGSGPFTLLPDAEIPFAFSLPMTVSAVGVLDNLTVSFPFTIADGYLFTQLGDEVLGFPLSTDMLEEFGLDLGSMDDDPMGDVGGMLGMDDTMMDDTSLYEYVNHERLADATVMGETMYPFRLSVDIGAIINSPEFQEIFAMLSMMGMGETGAGMEDLGMVLMLLPMLAEGLEADFAVTQYVAPSDNYIRKLTVEVNLELDLSLLFGFGAPEGADMPEMDPVVVSVLFDVELDNINEPVSVQAPADARRLTEEEAEAFLDGFLAAMGGF